MPFSMSKEIQTIIQTVMVCGRRGRIFMIFRFSTNDFNLCNFRSHFVFYPKFCIKPIYPPSPLNYDFGKTMHYIISLVNVKVRKVYEHLGGGGLDFFKI